LVKDIRATRNADQTGEHIMPNNAGKPGSGGNRNQQGQFRHSGADSSRHTSEKAAQKDNRSKSGSDKARGEST
jgi:hypothetical protein